MSRLSSNSKTSRITVGQILNRIITETIEGYPANSLEEVPVHLALDETVSLEKEGSCECCGKSRTEEETEEARRPTNRQFGMIDCDPGSWRGAAAIEIFLETTKGKNCSLTANGLITSLVSDANSAEMYGSSAKGSSGMGTKVLFFLDGDLGIDCEEMLITEIGERPHEEGVWILLKPLKRDPKAVKRVIKKATRKKAVRKVARKRVTS